MSFINSLKSALTSNRKMACRRYTRSKFGDFLNAFLLITAGLFTMLPLIYAVCTSFKPLDELLIFPPRFFDVVFKLYAEWAVVPSVCKTAVNFATCENEASAFAQGNQFVHRQFAFAFGINTGSNSGYSSTTYWATVKLYACWPIWRMYLRNSSIATNVPSRFWADQ